MEIELGLKVSRPSREAISTNLRITKDGCNPLFLSIETKTMFILTANLKGYPREKLKIDINGDGTEIAISGEKGDEVRGFRKVFRIPSGVVLDGINATFNEEESVLKILMPKSVKGISGVGIQEVKEDETNGGNHEMAHPEKSEAAKVEAGQVNQGAQIEEHKGHEENGGVETHHRSQRQDDQTESVKPDHLEEVEGMGNDIPAQADGTEVEPPQETVNDGRKGSLAPSRKSKLCSPCFLAGSAILVSIIAIVFHYIRPKRR